MTTKLFWLVAFVLLYWAYCLYWGTRSAMMAGTASDYFISGRRLPLWVFVLAATATSFSGWTFMGHPGLVYRDGFQYVYAAFSAIAIPFTGVLFLKRQWMLGKRYGYVTPGEMLSDYFQGDGIRLLSVAVALFFSIPFLGIQLRASGLLFNALTDGLLDVEVGMWLLSIVVFIYVASGGLRAVAYVDTLQCLLLAFGIAALGAIAVTYVGGWSALTHGIASLAVHDTKLTPDGYSHYVAIPGEIQFVASGEQAVGGAWTATMVLTSLFALMGIQSAPAFSMWAFSNRSPAPFAPQQVWVSSLGIGLLLFFFTTFQGIAGHLLGADPSMADSGLTANVLNAGHANFTPDALVPSLMNLIESGAPWMIGLLAVCALAAMQSTGAAYLSTAGGILTRDLYKHYLDRSVSHAAQMILGRIGVLAVVAAALLLATYGTDALVLLGGLAVAYGFQMWPALIAVCWWPWLTRQGVTWGLFAGILAVTCTESIAAPWMPWGRWPLTIHSAAWGMFLNLAVTIAVSYFTQERRSWDHRLTFHRFLYDHAGLSPNKLGLVPAAWIIALLWFFFAIGPGAVIGNTIFGDPNNPATWAIFGMPSIWAWQILWWVLGVGMMWFLAYHMEMSVVPHKDVEALVEDIGDRDIA